MAQVTLEQVAKKFDQVTAVRDVNLTINDKEFVVLVGPSGCGKSTTLRMVAALEEITAGTMPGPASEQAKTSRSRGAVGERE